MSFIRKERHQCLDVAIGHILRVSVHHAIRAQSGAERSQLYPEVVGVLTCEPRKHTVPLAIFAMAFTASWNIFAGNAIHENFLALGGERAAGLRQSGFLALIILCKSSDHCVIKL